MSWSFGLFYYGSIFNCIFWRFLFQNIKFERQNHIVFNRLKGETCHISKTHKATQISAEYPSNIGYSPLQCSRQVQSSLHRFWKFTKACSRWERLHAQGYPTEGFLLILEKFLFCKASTHRGNQASLLMTRNQPFKPNILKSKKLRWWF